MHGACDIIFYFLTIVYLLTIGFFFFFEAVGGGQIAIGTQVRFLSPVTACIFTVFFIVFRLYNILNDVFIK